MKIKKGPISHFAPFVSLAVLVNRRGRKGRYKELGHRPVDAESNQNINGAIRRSIARIEPISTPIEMKIASG
jgi:hypothetical protein